MSASRPRTFRRHGGGLLVIATTLAVGFGAGYFGMHVTQTWLQGDKQQVSAVSSDQPDSIWPTPNPEVIVNLPAEKFTQLDMEKLMASWCDGSMSEDVRYAVLRECVDRPDQPEQ